jgi:hypothetical protein
MVKADVGRYVYPTERFGEARASRPRGRHDVELHQRGGIFEQTELFNCPF